LKYVVAAVDEIPPGGRKILDIGGRSVGVFNIDGEYFALRNRCPHQGGALCEGTLWGSLRASAPGDFQYQATREILTCPWHGWEFHVRTGQSWCEPRRLRVRRYDVSVEEGAAVLGADEALTQGAEAQVLTAEADPQVLTAERGAQTADPDAPAAGMVRGPFVVETYPVEVEGTYVIVEIPGSRAGSGR
jgi:3-phenylpropionate/trans-cinnamate dioxygenase ferredoxin subunit